MVMQIWLKVCRSDTKVYYYPYEIDVPDPLDPTKPPTKQIWETTSQDELVNKLNELIRKYPENDIKAVAVLNAQFVGRVDDVTTCPTLYISALCTV